MDLQVTCKKCDTFESVRVFQIELQVDGVGF